MYQNIYIEKPKQGKPLVHIFEIKMMSGVNLNREELVIILYEIESRLQEAISENIPKRIEFYTKLSIKLHNEMRKIAEGASSSDG